MMMLETLGQSLIGNEVFDYSNILFAVLFIALVLVYIISRVIHIYDKLTSGTKSSDTFMVQLAYFIYSSCLTLMLLAFMFAYFYTLYANMITYIIMILIYVLMIILMYDYGYKYTGTNNTKKFVKNLISQGFIGEFMFNSYFNGHTYLYMILGIIASLLMIYDYNSFFATAIFICFLLKICIVLILVKIKKKDIICILQVLVSCILLVMAMIVNKDIKKNNDIMSSINDNITNINDDITPNHDVL